jgi:hypothetical protein
MQAHSLTIIYMISHFHTEYVKFDLNFMYKYVLH